MSEIEQPKKRGGRPFHSILEPHFDFIREQRRQRKTWQEIADLLFTEKSIRVTFHAPYLFYRRKLKRMAKPHWEDMKNNQLAPPTRPDVAASRPQPRPAPLPPSPTFKRPDPAKLTTDEYHE